jgi:phytoene synthase
MSALDSAELLAELPPPLGLAVAYASARARLLWVGFLALDHRLERAALGVREPIIGQIKLAWWRERFRTPAEQWPTGEPLLGVLHGWEAEREALVQLVDGWEGLVGGEPDEVAVTVLIDARGEALAALARLVGEAGEVERIRAAGRHWASADLAARLDLARETLPTSMAYQLLRLPRALRPLNILAELARPGKQGLARQARIMRLGLFGR